MGAGEKPFEIPLRIGSALRLFHALDPSPFRERDLDAEAERHIIGWAQEAPKGAPFVVVIELPKDQHDAEAEPMLADAVRNYFAYRADITTRELHELFREGRQALSMGLPILVVTLGISELIAYRAGERQLVLRIISDSLPMLGWVANWRPIEIFLYGWWPITRRRNLYRRLAAARVAVRWA